MFGHEEIVRLVEFQEEIVNALNVEKFVPEVFVLDEDIEKEVEAKATKDLLEAIKVTDKKEREEAIEAVKDAVINTYDEDDEETLEHVKITLDNMVKTDRKSTRLNSSHVAISYAVFCLKKKRRKE